MRSYVPFRVVSTVFSDRLRPSITVGGVMVKLPGSPRDPARNKVTFPLVAGSTAAKFVSSVMPRTCEGAPSRRES